MRIGFVIFLLIFLAVLALGEYSVYATVIFFGVLAGRLARDGILALFVILPLTFIFVEIFSQTRKNLWLRILYFPAAAWFGFLFYFLLASLLSWVSYNLFGGWAGQAVFSRLSTGLFAAGIAVSLYGLVNARLIRIRELELAIPNLPAFWRGKTAVLFADSHLGLYAGKPYMEKIVAHIRELRPDAVFVPGDFFDGPLMDFADAASPLGQIAAPLGKYFSFGNHDEFVRNRASVIGALERAGVKVLADESVEKDGLQIMGIDYRFNEKAADFQKLLRSLNFDPRKPSVLLYHAPGNVADAAAGGVSLMLSGHTHLGQLFPASLITRWIYKRFHYGLHHFGNLAVYTTNGVSTWGPPMRVGKRPEIVRIRFK